MLNVYELSLEQMRSDITEDHHKELQELKMMYALEVEQLEAKPSDVHLQGSIHKHIQSYLKIVITFRKLNK